MGSDTHAKNELLFPCRCTIINLLRRTVANIDMRHSRLLLTDDSKHDKISKKSFKFKSTFMNIFKCLWHDLILHVTFFTVPDSI